MLTLVCNAVRDSFPTRTVRFDDPISCHHNYVTLATGRSTAWNWLVTRKGCHPGRHGDLGLIPGSMGTGSCVVRGLGSEQSFFSASHGAGRRMSRSKARKLFTADDLIAQTQGVESHRTPGRRRIPAAYKGHQRGSSPPRPTSSRSSPTCARWSASGLTPSPHILF